MLRLFTLTFCLLLSAFAAHADTYPRDVRIAFLERCVKLNKQMIAPCKCMLQNFQNTLTLEQFVELSKTQTPDGDRRFTMVATHCINTHR